MDSVKMIKDFERLFKQARDAYNNPNSTDEVRNWGFYTATAIQSVLEGNGYVMEETK
jgi:hypothetical protein